MNLSSPSMDNYNPSSSPIYVQDPVPHEVTLTNWERLNNAPILLPKASAVQWNDYLFVLAKDGTALLYHTKLKIWSMLPEIPNLSENIQLVNYQGQILTVNKYSEMFAFDTSSSQWTNQTGPPGTAETSCIAINDDTLYAYSRKQKIMGEKISSDECIHTLFSRNRYQWIEHDKTSSALSLKLFSTSEHFFEEVANKIYRYKIEKTLEAESESTPKEQPKEITLPPYRGFSLHVIKDALFSFGGIDRDNQPTSDVLRYNPDTDTWESAGYMRSARYNVAVTTMQQGHTTEVYVLGGELGSSKLIMQPKLRQVAVPKSVRNLKKNPFDWDFNWCCSTSIIEKCTLFN